MKDEAVIFLIGLAVYIAVGIVLSPIRKSKAEGFYCLLFPAHYGLMGWASREGDVFGIVLLTVVAVFFSQTDPRLPYIIGPIWIGIFLFGWKGK